MQALRRIAKIGEIPIFRCIRMGKPLKLHGSSSVEGLSSEAGVHLLHGMKEEQSFKYRSPVKTGSALRCKVLIAIVSPQCDRGHTGGATQATPAKQNTGNQSKEKLDC
jgi:hypothetical protein